MNHPTMLFPSMEARPEQKAEGPFAAVAIERSLDRVLDYAIPKGLVPLVRAGQRVRVPLGRNNKPTLGYVVGIKPDTDYPKVKPLIAIDDERVLLPPALMDLARWMSRYYCSPLGTVIDSVVPSAVKKKIGLGYTAMVRLIRPRADVQAILERTKAPKRRAILARLLLLEPDYPIELLKLASESGATPATVRKLVKMGLISITSQPDFEALSPSALEGEGRGESAQGIPELNDDQRRVFDELLPRVQSPGFSVNLLHGVTGSGKTEVYLRCIQEVVERGRRAIALVPEIALTPQTVRRFTARFRRVAILHSGLRASARHRFWQQIANGQADVVVGARSAIFAPLPDLGIIVVDEEHESSYKQDTAPRYHARDIAIKRAQLENLPVILGSATPSLESFQRAQGSGFRVLDSAIGSASADAAPTQASSRYHLLTLPSRVRGLQLPHIELVDMRQEARFHRQGVHLISRRLEHLLRTTVEAGHQAILLLNRRGYSSFVYCSSCAHPVQCKYCDATMTYHRSAGVKATSGKSEEGIHTGQLHCHYCLAVNALPDRCPDCGKKLSLFGLGTQRVEEELKRKLPELRFARVDSDSMHSAKDYETLLGRFGRGEIQVMLGTQMIAKGLDYPNVTLVGVISGDTALSLPDFRAAERTFQLITQVAGRAGRGEHPGRVVLQTFQQDDPTIQAAIKQDFLAFARRELDARKEVGLPPFARMVRIILRDDDLEKLHDRSERLAAILSAATGKMQAEGRSGTIQLKGPMPCAINRIAGYHRAQILLFSPGALALQNLLAIVRVEKAFADTERIAVDVDPVSLL